MQQVTETVYRIEHARIRNSLSDHYIGPFNGSCDEGCGVDIYNLHSCETESPTSHPPPSRDGIEQFEEHHVFGASTRDDLFTWFPCEHGRSAMAEAGFVVRAYNVALIPEKHRGSIQVAMDCRDAVLIEEFSLLDL